MNNLIEANPIEYQGDDINNCAMKNFGCKWSGTLKEFQEFHKPNCVFLQFQAYFEGISKKFKENEDKKDLEIINLKQAIEMQNREIINLKQKVFMNSPYQGILKGLSMNKLLQEGFKIGLCQKYSYKNSFDELVKYNTKKFVILAGRKTGEDTLLLAALGQGKKVFKETFHDKESRFHNGVYWYFMKQKSVGFSLSRQVYLSSADWIEDQEKRAWEDEKLSWSLAGNGGWRVGSFISLTQSNDYEKILLYLE